MNTFWLKIAVLVVVVLLGGILISKFFSSEIDKATDLEAAAERHEAAETKLQDQLQEAQTQAEQKKEQEETAPTPPRITSLPTTPPPQTVPDDDDIVSSVEAERLYNMALTQYKIGRKLMTFKKMVDYCRELFDKYPNSPEAAKARVLMRNMPERYRELYNVTEQELGVEK